MVTSSLSPAKINNIQVVRGVAASLVVLFHSMGTPWNYPLRLDLLKPLNGWGFGGVDLFFVISGFLMIYIQSHKMSTASSFMIDRLLRILPLYWSLNALMLVFYVFFHSVFSGLKITPIWAASSWFFISQIVTGKLPVLYAGWTLEYEIPFYLVFASAIALGHNIKHTALTANIVLIFSAILTQKWILLEFTLGILLGLYHQSVSPQKNSSTALCLGVFAFAMTILVPHLNSSNLLRVFFYGPASLLIIHGCIGIHQIKHGFLTRLGDASYSIYLVQVFTIPGFHRMLKWFNADPAYSDIWVMLIWAGTLLSGIILYEVYERKVASGLIKALKSVTKPRLQASQGATAV